MYQTLVGFIAVSYFVAYAYAIYRDIPNMSNPGQEYLLPPLSIVVTTLAVGVIHLFHVLTAKYKHG